MDFILFIIFVVAIFFILEWIKRKLIGWASRDTNAIESNERIEHIAFFAAIGIVVTLIQVTQWLVKVIAWVIHLFV